MDFDTPSAAPAQHEQHGGTGGHQRGTEPSSQAEPNPVAARPPSSATGTGATVVVVVGATSEDDDEVEVSVGVDEWVTVDVVVVVVVVVVVTLLLGVSTTPQPYQWLICGRFPPLLNGARRSSHGSSSPSLPAR